MTWGGQSVKSGMSGISTGGRLSTVVLPRSSKTSGVQPGSEYSITTQYNNIISGLLWFISSVYVHIDYRPEEEEENKSGFSHLHMHLSPGTRLVILIVHRSSLVPRTSITANVMEGLVKLLHRMTSGRRWVDVGRRGLSHRAYTSV